MNRKSGLVILVAVLVAGCASLGSRAPAGVDMTGIWDLDAAHSDKPSVLMRHVHRQGRPARRHRRFGEMSEEGGMYGGPGSIGHGPGGGFPVGRPGGMGGDFNADPMRLGRLSELGAHELDIEQRQSSMRIEYDRKQTVFYHWGEQQSRRSFGEPPSGWVKGNFVIKAGGRDGHGMERTFKLSGNHQTLTVVTKLGKHAMTQVYDLNKAATAKVYGGAH